MRPGENMLQRPAPKKYMDKYMAMKGLCEDTAQVGVGMEHKARACGQWAICLTVEGNETGLPILVALLISATVSPPPSGLCLP